MDNFIIFLAYFGLLCGALRVIPQTILTIKTKDITNLSYTFFTLHMISGILGNIYEYYSEIPSMPHILFFTMVTITNFIQIVYMRFFCPSASVIE